MIESDYIERDMADLNADQLKLLKALTDRYQSFDELS